MILTCTVLLPGTNAVAITLLESSPARLFFCSDPFQFHPTLLHSLSLSYVSFAVIAMAVVILFCRVFCSISNFIRENQALTIFSRASENARPRLVKPLMTDISPSGDDAFQWSMLVRDRGCPCDPSPVLPVVCRR